MSIFFILEEYHIKRPKIVTLRFYALFLCLLFDSKLVNLLINIIYYKPKQPR